MLFCIVNLFNHPLCALSAFESLGCPRAAVLRDLRRGLVGLGAESGSGTLSSRKTSALFPLERCLFVLRRPTWNACCTVRSPGEGPPRVPRTTLGGQSCPSPLCLRVSHRGTSGAGKAGPGGWAACLGPQDAPSWSQALTQPVVTPCHSLSVVAGRRPWSVAFTILMKNCDARSEGKGVAVVSVVTEYRVTQ